MDPEDYVVMLLFNGRYPQLSLTMNRLKPSGNYVYHVKHNLKSLHFAHTLYSFAANDSQHQKDYFPEHHSVFGACTADGVFLREVGTDLHTADKSLARQGRKRATATEDLMFMYPTYNHNRRNISTIYIRKTRLASNEIFSPSNKIHREVGRAKDLSAPWCMHNCRGAAML
jgi:hypothetical protein